jgi:hypothetical protein
MGVNRDGSHTPKKQLLVGKAGRLMPRDGAMTFGDLIGQLEALEIACPKCDRVGRYSGPPARARTGPRLRDCGLDWRLEALIRK